jgi:hypothetical protein
MCNPEKRQLPLRFPFNANVPRHECDRLPVFKTRAARRGGKRLREKPCLVAWEARRSLSACNPLPTCQNEGFLRGFASLTKR